MSTALLHADDRVGPWIVTRRIGRGTFSEVYEARHARTRALCALKIDKPVASVRPNGLVHESAVLQHLQRFACVPRHYGLYDAPTPEAGLPASAATTPPPQRAKVLAMQLLGDSMSSVRAALPGEQFPLGAALALAAQMLGAVEAVHCAGFVHRDIKPSNFALGLASRLDARGVLHILDFGQARQYVSAFGGAAGGCGELRVARAAVEFRGTSLYASLHAHRREDLSRRDDLWSWFYALVDLARGGLPWRPFKDDRARCGELKAHYAAHPCELVAGLPGAGELLSINFHLLSLSFASKPDYAFLSAALQRCIDAATTAGALATRPRHAYSSSLALASVLASRATEEDVKGGVSGRGFLSGAVPVVFGEREVGLPSHSRSNSVMSGSSARGGQGGGGVASAAEVLALSDSAAAVSPTPLSVALSIAQREADTDAITAYSQHQAPCSSASLLHGHGGGWDNAHAFFVLGGKGVPLDVLLMANHAGEPTDDARGVVSALEQECDSCEALLMGFDCSTDGALSLTSPIFSLPQPTAVFKPETLQLWVQPGFVSVNSSKGNIAARPHLTRSPASILRGIYARLAILPHALVWGAWEASAASNSGSFPSAAAADCPATAPESSAAVSSSVAGFAPAASTVGPGPSALLAYLSSWCGLAEAVLALPLFSSALRSARSVIATRATAPSFSTLPVFDDNMSDSDASGYSSKSADATSPDVALLRDCAAAVQSLLTASICCSCDPGGSASLAAGTPVANGEAAQQFNAALSLARAASSVLSAPRRRAEFCRKQLGTVARFPGLLAQLGSASQPPPTSAPGSFGNAGAATGSTVASSAGGSHGLRCSAHPVLRAGLIEMRLHEWLAVATDACLLQGSAAPLTAAVLENTGGNRGAVRRDAARLAFRDSLNALSVAQIEWHRARPVTAEELYNGSQLPPGVVCAQQTTVLAPPPLVPPLPPPPPQQQQQPQPQQQPQQQPHRNQQLNGALGGDAPPKHTPPPLSAAPPAKRSRWEDGPPPIFPAIRASDWSHGALEASSIPFPTGAPFGGHSSGASLLGVPRPPAPVQPGLAPPMQVQSQSLLGRPPQQQFRS